MTPVTFVVTGKPVPQPRQRIARTGHHFTPDNGIRAYRQSIVAVALASFDKPFSCPVRLRVRFIFQRPKSHFTKRGELTKAARAVRMPMTGDVSNYVKGLEDALNGIAFTDDRLIAVVEACKVFGTHPRTEVQVDEISSQGWEAGAVAAGSGEGDRAVG